MVHMKILSSLPSCKGVVIENTQTLLHRKCCDYPPPPEFLGDRSVDFEAADQTLFHLQSPKDVSRPVKMLTDLNVVFRKYFE